MTSSACPLWVSKLLWLRESLKGKTVYLEGEGEFVVEDVQGTRKAVVTAKHYPDAKRRVSMKDLFLRYVRAISHDEKGNSRHANYPVELKMFACTLVKQQEVHVQELREAKKQAASLRKQLAHLRGKLARAKEQNAHWGDAQLPECKDTHTVPSIEAKLERCEAQLLERKQQLEELQGTRSENVFSSFKAIVSFLNDELGLVVSGRSLYRWRRDGIPTQGKGRAPAFSAEAEAMLLETIFWIDSMGFAVDKKRVMALANELAVSDDIRSRFSKDGPTVQWYEGWVKRMMKKGDKQLIRAIERGIDSNATKWFNTTNINWWFDLFVKKVLDYGFARLPQPGEYGEAIWLYPERVFVTDETCVSGGNTRKSANNRREVLTTADRAEDVGRGKKYRRLSTFTRATNEHVTLIAGHSLDAEMTIPIWIFPAKTGLRDETRRKIERVAPVYPLVPKYNGIKFKDVIIGTSPGGGITRENSTELIIRMVKVMYPDVADTPGKRVLWLTDWHDSRLCISLMRTLQKMGVVMMGWLPNTTSKMQSPDVALFGPFKARRDVLENTWVSHNPGRSVDKVAKVEIAGKALADTFTADRMRRGARDTGICPIDRQVLLSHPCIADGNVLEADMQSTMRSGTLDLLQRTPPPIVPQSPPMQFNLTQQQAENYNTPDRLRHAEDTFTSVSQQQPRLGKFQTMCQDLNTTESISNMANKLVSNIEVMIFSRNENLNKYKEKLKDTIRRKEEVIRQKEEEIKRLSATFAEKHKRELAGLKHWQEQVQEIGTNPDKHGNATPQILSIIAEKLDDVFYAERDELGLARGRDDVPPLSKPSFQPIEGLNVDSLTSNMEEIEEHMARRSRPPTQTTNQQPGKPTRFKAGALMQYTGEIEGTGENWLRAIEDHEEKKAAEKAAKARKQQARDRQRVGSMLTLKERLRDSLALVKQQMATNKVSVKDCRAFLKVAADYAKAIEDQEGLHHLQTLQQLKRDELLFKLGQFIAEYEQSLS